MGFSRQEYWGGLPFPPPGDRDQSPNPDLGEIQTFPEIELLTIFPLNEVSKLWRLGENHTTGLVSNQPMAL